MTTATSASVATATILTPQEKLIAATTKMMELQEGLKAKVISGEDFTADAIAYTVAVTAQKGLMQAANQGAIDEATAQIGQGIATMVVASKLSELLGVPVTSLYWTFEPGEGENGPIMRCGLNVKARASAPKKESADGTSGGSGRKSPENFTIDGAAPLSARDFIDQYATEDTRNNNLFSSGKWVVKPSFLDAAVAKLEGEGHTVVREVVSA